jgi:hypothetical protein
MKDLLKRCETEMRYAGWSILEVDNPQRQELYFLVQAALAQPAQEPWCMKMNRCTTKCEDCPDEPAQRPWVGLTDEDHMQFAILQFGWDELIAAVEAKLKEKNSD